MIFYLSCTGNTLWAARKTADVTGDKLVDIAKVMRHAKNNDETFNFTLDENEAVGFFFPVHGWRPPVLVREFTARLRLAATGCHYCYTVCTAGDNIGETVSIFEHDLAAVGIKNNSAISLIMPESYVGLPFMDVDTKYNEQKKKRAADEKLTRFISDIKARRKSVYDLTIGRWPKTNSRLIGHVFLKHLITDKPFRVNADKCVGCGKCSATCPVGDITMGDDRRPHWTHNGQCLTCFACYHHCPEKAIEFGWRTNGKGQYYYERNNV